MARSRLRDLREAANASKAEVTQRDFVMARLAAARSSLQAALDAIDESVALFVDPEDDRSGDTRKEAISEALECTGAGSRALESAEQAIEHVDPLEIEPWEED